MVAERETLDTILKDLKKLESKIGWLTSQIQKVLSGGLNDIPNVGFEELKNSVLNVERKASEMRKILEYGLNVKPQGGSRLESYAPAIIIRCKNWEDFKVQAQNPEAVSFLYKAEDKTFQADALKGGKVLTYSGLIPSDVVLLKAWLAKELNASESKIVEGVLAIG